MLVHPFDVLCCACASISLLHECTNSVLDVVIHNISLHLSLINDYLLSMISTDKTSNLDIKSESVLSFYSFDPTKCFVYDPPMARLIPDFNMSLDVDAIFAAHASQPESMLSDSCDFDPRKCFVYDLPMSKLIPDFNMSLDVDTIFAAHASQPESMLSDSCDFDPRTRFVYDPPMSKLIPDFNMSLDVDNIFAAHASQLVSKALGVAWVMPLKQWLSWLKSFASWINNTCLVLCHTFVFDNG